MSRFTGYMMHTEPIHRRPDSLPNELNSPQAKLVYLYLETVGTATPDDLTDALSMKKISVLSILSSLSSDGLVEHEGDRFVAKH